MWESGFDGGGGVSCSIVGDSDGCEHLHVVVEVLIVFVPFGVGCVVCVCRYGVGEDGICCYE